MSLESNVGAIARQFQICGEFQSAAPYGSGHINDTYRVMMQNAGTATPFILQRINTGIFKDPVALMENIQRVTTHLGSRVLDQPDRDRRILTLIPARDGRAWYVDADGGYWRAYSFIQRARSYDSVERPEQALQAARAFGQFQQPSGRPAFAAIARHDSGLSSHAEEARGLGAGNRGRHSESGGTGEAGDRLRHVSRFDRQCSSGCRAARTRDTQ